MAIACSRRYGAIRDGLRVDRLGVKSDLFIESLPTRTEFEALLGPLGMQVTAYQDESNLYLMVAQKTP